MSYDDNNIFAKILRGEIPNSTIFENEYCLAFNDISPLKKKHGLVIPKSSYVDLTDFINNAPDDEQLALNKAIIQTADALGLLDSGYRVISNVGNDGGQEVPHLHWHILGGENVGKLTS